MRIILPLLVFSVLFSGCPSSNAKQKSDALIDATCRFYFQCCSAAERSYLGINGQAIGSNVEECQEELKRTGSDTANQLGEAEAEERITFDEEKYAECNDELLDALATCDYEMLSTVDQCTGTPWIVGQVDNGEICYASNECSDDEATCVHVSALQEPDDEAILITAEGECVPPHEVGDDCSDGEPCRDGLVCSFNGQGNLVCEELPGIGEPCPLGSCDSASYCDFGSSECIELKANNFECVSDFECESRLCETDPDDNNAQELCTEDCIYSGDGTCDDGGPDSNFGLCDEGTDCLDCGTRTVGRSICSAVTIPDNNIVYGICEDPNAA